MTHPKLPCGDFSLARARAFLKDGIHFICIDASGINYLRWRCDISKRKASQGVTPSHALTKKQTSNTLFLKGHILEGGDIDNSLCVTVETDFDAVANAGNGQCI